jgi:hypothetical protein
LNNSFFYGVKDFGLGVGREKKFDRTFERTFERTFGKTFEPTFGKTICLTTWSSKSRKERNIQNLMRKHGSQ